MHRYFMSQSSEFCCHYPLSCFSILFIVVSVYLVMTVRNLLDTPSYVNWRMAGQIYGVFLLVLQAN